MLKKSSIFGDSEDEIISSEIVSSERRPNEETRNVSDLNQYRFQCSFKEEIPNEVFIRFNDGFVVDTKWLSYDKSILNSEHKALFTYIVEDLSFACNIDVVGSLILSKCNQVAFNFKVITSDGRSCDFQCFPIGSILVIEDYCSCLGNHNKFILDGLKEIMEDYGFLTLMEEK